MAAQGANRRAVGVMVKALRALGRLEDVDSAIVRATERLADAVDQNPKSPGLWSVYLEALDRLAVIGEVEDDDFSDLIEQLSSEMGDAS